MKKEFIVERSGKSFVLYAGLLDEAHNQGLKSLVTNLLQIPNDENGNVAICQATVETEKGTFTGLGDASPTNVARPMVCCLIRMAETRAKARALRDAVNVGVVALEELGGEDTEEPLEAPRAKTVAAARAPFTFVERALGNDEPRATAAQVRAIYAIARNQLGLSEPQTDERCQEAHSCTPAELSKRQASDFITRLQGGEGGR
ncbi:MAG: hypothetical protein M0Z94_16465 [Dehalococcoidales bacterium]|nr:hypothetical protein [Dehalococcoidales bacterium]